MNAIAIDTCEDTQHERLRMISRSFLALGPTHERQFMERHAVDIDTAGLPPYGREMYRMGYRALHTFQQARRNGLEVTLEEAMRAALHEHCCKKDEAEKQVWVTQFNSPVCSAILAALAPLIVA